MRDFLFRFITAGLLVASLPWVAQQFGARAAGVVLLFPIVTISGLTVVGLQGGSEAVARASAGALMAVPAVLVFLLAVQLAARQGVRPVLSVAIGVTAWLVVATIVIIVERDPGG